MVDVDFREDRREELFQELYLFLDLVLNLGFDDSLENLAVHHRQLTLLARQNRRQSQLSRQNAQLSEDLPWRQSRCYLMEKLPSLLVEQKRVISVLLEQERVWTVHSVFVLDQDVDRAAENDVEVLGHGTLLEDYIELRTDLVFQIEKDLQDLLVLTVFDELLEEIQVFELLKNLVSLRQGAILSLQKLN